MIEDIPSLIARLLSQLGSVDIAESEFKRMINDDAQMKSEFKAWCEEMGYKENSAFIDYYDEYIVDNDLAFDTLSDYNE